MLAQENKDHDLKQGRGALRFPKGLHRMSKSTAGDEGRFWQRREWLRVRGRDKEAERKECWSVYAVGWNWLRAKAKEGMVTGESKRRGKQIGRSAGACMLWGVIWLRAKAKDGMVAGE